jgi:hypothetical protein
MKRKMTSQSILEVSISISAGILARLPIFIPIRLLIALLEAISTSLCVITPSKTTLKTPSF